MNQIRFAIIGGGWRSLFYMRIAREMPERFCVTSVAIRNEAKGREFEAAWGVPTCREVSGIKEGKPDFVLVSVPWPVTPQLIRELAAMGMPVLAETPPAPDIDALIALHKDIKPKDRVQVAEQYPLVPIHAARQSLVDSGLLGEVMQAQVSVAHGYHGIALLRKLLHAGFEDATISARVFRSPIMAGSGRSGPPAEEKIVDSSQTIAYLDFGKKLGVFDFTGEQYFSWVRAPRVLIRGDRGEIVNDTVRYLKDFKTPITLSLLRQDAGLDGNLEGYFHKGITAGSDWVYTNPFPSARLADDEIAVATCLQKMSEYVQGGPEFYGLAEAAQDHYFGIMIDRAAASGETIRTGRQPWAA